MHDTWACTGFTGIYPNGTHSSEIEQKALELLEREASEAV